MMLVATEDRESASRPSEMTDNYLKGNLEFNISPSAEPKSILTFHNWMEQVGGSTITRVSGNFHRGTVLSVYVATPISLTRLTELHLVAGFVEQRNTSSKTDARSENELGEEKGNAGQTDEPRRFWVVLNQVPSRIPSRS